MKRASQLGWFRRESSRAQRFGALLKLRRTTIRCRMLWVCAAGLLLASLTGCATTHSNSAQGSRPNGPDRWPLLRGTLLTARPEWVHESSRSSAYGSSLNGSNVQFSVRDPWKCMKWEIAIPHPINPDDWSAIELQYRAKGLFDDGQEYVLWVSDDARKDHSGGFEAIVPHEIIPDGRSHMIRVELARFNPPGRIRGLMVRVRTGGRGGGILVVEGLDLVREGGPAEEVEN